MGKETCKKNFYEKEEMVKTLVDADRSKKSFKILKDVIFNSSVEELKILDLGCGNGEFMKIIADLDRKVKVWGIDTSNLAINQVEKKGFRGFVVDINRRKLPFPEDFFDIIYSGDVIEHLVDPDLMIKEVKRTLKEDGFLILTTPNLASWYNRLLLLFGFQPIFSEVSTEKVFGRPGSEIVGHLRLYTLKSLKDFLSHHGLKIINIEGAYFHGFNSILKAIDNFFTRFPSISSILVVTAQRTQNLSRGNLNSC